MFCRFLPFINAWGRKPVEMSFITDKEIRSYLLGNLADDPREQIEDTLLVSDEGLLRLEMAEEDLIEEFLDDQLDAEQLDLFENHFLCTKARKDRLDYLRAVRAVAARQMESESATGKVINLPVTQTRRPFFVGMNRSGYLKLAAVILLIGSVGLLVWRYALRPSQSASLVALNRAYAGGRTLETRIGGLDYAPYAPTRGANDADTNARIFRERAGLVLLDAYTEHPTPANRHMLGKYYLAEKRFDQAIEQFNAALKETPSEAELHNDLGAALLEKARDEKRNNQPGESLQHLAASLESIEQALKLQPDYPAAVFNRALCLQEMYLSRQAIAEWKKYLQLDGKSKWADEARRRLAELEKAPSKVSLNDGQLYQEYQNNTANDDVTFDLFCQAYSTIGNGITERLIDDLLAAKERRDESEAIHKLQLLEKLGALVYQRTTDPYVRDVARYYRQINSKQQTFLLQARHHLAEGIKLRSTSQSQAAANYENAIALFLQAQDQGEAKMTTCLLARLHLRQSNLEKSSELFARLTGKQNPYIWLRSDSFNGMAELYKVKSLPNDSIRANQSALSYARQLGSTNQIVTNLVSLALKYGELGNWEQALAYQQQSLEIISRKPTGHQQHWATNSGTAYQFFTVGFYSAALAYQQEALNIELITKRQLQLSRTYTHLGVMLGKVRRFTESIPLAREAVNIGIRQGNEKTGKEIQAYSGSFLADLQRESGDYLEALRSYERVIDLNRELGMARYDYEAYRGKALAEIALGHTDQAKRDLTHALTIFEQNRGQIVAEEERTTYLDKEYEAYDAAIGVAYVENPKEAFDLSERGRAPSLLETMKSAGPTKASKAVNDLPVLNRIQPLSLHDVQRRMPSQVILLEFVCLQDRVLVFGVSTKSFANSQYVIPLSQLEQKVRSFLREFSKSPKSYNNQTVSHSVELYRILIEPLEHFLSGAQTICVVPDKALYHLPFAALFSDRRQKYLIEDHALVTSPSASVFLLCLERARSRQSLQNERLLAVGNPRFDLKDYPTLPELTAARREVNSIADNYNRRNVLIAEQATEGKVKAQIKQSTIVHLATHGIIDERSWANSRLLLANSTVSDGEDGALRAYEIAAMRLPLTRLVVLSACQSGVERFYRGEGMIGLGRAFLVAGVPTVVASLWDVDSEVTAMLMTEFHHQLKQHSAPQALRRAQLSLLYQANSQYRHPYYWAAFSTFGADALL